MQPPNDFAVSKRDADDMIQEFLRIVDNPFLSQDAYEHALHNFLSDPRRQHRVLCTCMPCLLKHAA